jgi:hypothetical protein
VEFHFSAEEWSRLTPEKRLKYCTIMAEESQKLADSADEKFKPLYLDLAVQWLMLASEMGKITEDENGR